MKPPRARRAAAFVALALLVSCGSLASVVGCSGGAAGGAVVYPVADGTASIVLSAATVVACGASKFDCAALGLAEITHLTRAALVKDAVFTLATDPADTVNPRAYFAADPCKQAGVALVGTLTITDSASDKIAFDLAGAGDSLDGHYEAALCPSSSGECLSAPAPCLIDGDCCVGTCLGTCGGL